MQPLLVLSIAHTGTMFTLDLLPGRRGAWPGPFESGRKYFCHVTDPHATQARQQCFMVTPLRRYQDVKASWTRNLMDTRDLARQWFELFSLKDVFFLPIDRPERDDQLEKLSGHLGVPLHTDWKPVHSMRAI